MLDALRSIAAAVGTSHDGAEVARGALIPTIRWVVTEEGRTP